MVDCPAVHQLALELGLQAAANWISKHPAQYNEGLSDGFAATEADRYRRVVCAGIGSWPPELLASCSLR